MGYLLEMGNCQLRWTYNSDDEFISVLDAYG